MSVLRANRKLPALPSLSAIALLVTLPACGERAEMEAGDDTEAPAAETTAPAAPAPDAVAQDYAPELEVDLAQMTRSPSGLYTQDLQEGSGDTAEQGRTVVVHYTGWLPNGQQFDSSRDRGPYDFPLGAGQVISGWDEGVAGMKVGGRRKLVIPPGLAYGEPGRGPIPPNATLVFDVELLEVR